jgi:cytochrome P450
MHNCIFLLNAGHETTTNLIGNGLHALLTHRASWSGWWPTPALIGTPRSRNCCASKARCS